MDYQEVLVNLRDYKDKFAEEYGILDIGIFGSTVRGGGGDESDVDVVVHLIKPDLFLLAGLKYDLQERLHRSIDIVAYRENMNQFLKKKIDSEAVYV